MGDLPVLYPDRGALPRRHLPPSSRCGAAGEPVARLLTAEPQSPSAEVGSGAEALLPARCPPTAARRAARRHHVVERVTEKAERETVQERVGTRSFARS
ncbi:hypothetical protein JCM11754A_17120 [Isoptericola variabilis]